MMETGDQGVESFGGMRRDEERGSKQVSQVLYQLMFILFRCVFLWRWGWGAVMTVSAPDPVNTDNVSRVSFFKQTHASCYQRARLYSLLVIAIC